MRKCDVSSLFHILNTFGYLLSELLSVLVCEGSNAIAYAHDLCAPVCSNDKNPSINEEVMGSHFWRYGDVIDIQSFLVNVLAHLHLSRAPSHALLQGSPAILS